ncbi:AsmA-like C-terminal region-containing protein [Cytophagaceae bacterium ABcell3]|nr:AsmA-like C-terminal region-containing protein [Cytophagaceae bacterium ABcell3]
MNKIVKNTVKSLAIIFAVVLLVVVSAVGAAWYNQDRIANIVLKQLNDAQEGQMEVSRVRVAPFRNFPYISIELDSLTLYPDKSGKSVPVYQIGEAYVGFDVYDLMRGEYTMKKILLKDGFLDYVKYEDGKINLFMAKSIGEESDDEGGEASEINLDLQELVIQNLLIKKTDYSSDQYTEVQLQDAKAKFAYRNNTIDIHIDADADLNDFSSGGTSFFHNKHMEVHTDVHYDMSTSYLKVDPSEFILEAATFEFGGEVSDIEDSIVCNIDLHAKKSNFDLIMAFAPDEYVAQLKDFNNKGEIFVKGNIQGPAGYGLTPQVFVEFGCANASFTNTSRNRNLRDINFTGYYTNGKERSMETSEIAIKNITANPDNSTFKGSFKVRNFVDPLIFMDLHTKLDLEVLSEFYAVDGVEYMKGIVSVDMTLDELIDPDSAIVVITKLRDGTDSRIIFDNVRAKVTNYPHEIFIKSGEIDMAGDNVILHHFNASIKDSKLDLKGEITRPMAVFHGQPGKVRFTLEGVAPELNLKELLAHDPAMAEEYNDVIRDLDFRVDFITTTEDLKEYKYIPQSDLLLDHLTMTIDKYPHKINDISGRVIMNDNKLTLHSFKASVGDNDLYITGDILNPEALMDENAQKEVKYNTTIKTKYLNVKELLYYDGKYLTSDEIEEEIIRDFEFVGAGNFISNSFCPSGFLSHTDIKHFTLRLNDFPALKDVKGVIDTDTSGTISLKGFYAKMGRTDVGLDLTLEHYLDTLKSHKHIRGKFKSKMLDFDELTNYQPASASNYNAEPVDHDSAFNVFALAFPDMELEVDIKDLRHHKYLISNIIGKVRSTPDHFLYIDKLALDAADGHVDIEGYFNGSNKDEIYFFSDINLKNIDIDKVFYKFDNFGQDYMINENLHGILDAEIKSKVHMYPDFVTDLAKTDATAKVTIKDGRLENFKPLHAMADYFSDKNLDNVRFGEMSNTFTIKDGYISFPSMKIASTLGYLYIEGKQDFDNNMDYEVKVPLQMVKKAGWSAAKSKLKRNKIEEKEFEDKEEDIIDEQTGILRKYITVSVSGNSDDFKVRLGKRRNK